MTLLICSSLISTVQVVYHHNTNYNSNVSKLVSLWLSVRTTTMAVKTKRTRTITTTTTTGSGRGRNNSNSRIRPYNICISSSRRSCSGDCMTRLLLRRQYWPIRVGHNSQLPTKIQYSTLSTFNAKTSIYFDENDTAVHTTTGSTTSTTIPSTSPTTPNPTELPSMQIQPITLMTNNTTVTTTINKIDHDDSTVAIESAEIPTDNNISSNISSADTINSSISGIPSKTMISDSNISNETNLTFTTTTTTVTSVLNESPSPPPQPQKYYTSVRLNKYMVLQQYAMSRRDADFFIQNGWIKVNGEIVSNQHYNNQIWMSSSSTSSSSSSSSQLSTTLENIDPSALLDPVIEMLPPAIQFQQKCRSTTVILNKPLGIISGLFGNPHLTSPYQPAIQLLTFPNMYRPQQYSSSPNKKKRRGRPEAETRNDQHDLDPSPLEGRNDSLEENESPPTQQQHSFPEPYRLSKLAVAGRLDINTTGLLLFTQDGHIASQIIGPQSNIEKEYLVRLSSSFDLLL